MKLVSAMVLDRPRRVNTKYGEKYVIDCLNRENGEKFPLWRPITDSYTEKYIIKNLPITVTLDSKGKYNLVEDPALTNLGKSLPVEPVPVKPVYDHKIEKTSERPSESEQSLLNPSQKREIANYVQEMAKLYKYCLDQAETTIKVDGEDKRAIATTLFISAQKKFAL